MLEQLRRILDAFAPAGETGGEDDVRVAAAALLVHVAEADGSFSSAERARLRALLQSEFALDTAAAERLIEEGRRADAEAVDLYRFTSVLMNRMDESRRTAFVDLVWSMAFVEDGVHELEDNLAWRIAELLGVSARDRMDAKRAAAVRAAKAEEPEPVAGHRGA